ncbi:MAG: GNAT family N-acetyltransferase [Myxococcota bacterium]
MYVIRPIHPNEPGAWNTVASFSMLTILETLPEARRDPSIVPNLSVEAMASSYAQHRSNPDHRVMVVEETSTPMVVGAAIALMRTDDDGLRYGYSYTRYILPAHRRRGLARQLLRQAIAWWDEQGAAYVLAHTHPSNAPLLGLFTSEGFVEVGRSNKRWPSVILKRVGPAGGV